MLPASCRNAAPAHFRHLEDIPADFRDWRLPVKGAQELASTLAKHWDQAHLFRLLATLVMDGSAVGTLDKLKWTGALPEFKAICETLDSPDMIRRAESLLNNSV